MAVDHDSSGEYDADEIAQAEAISRAMESGEPFTIVVECTDGTEELLVLHPCGINKNGGTQYMLHIEEDKLLSPGAIEIAAGLLADNLDAEISSLIGD